MRRNRTISRSSRYVVFLLIDDRDDRGDNVLMDLVVEKGIGDRLQG